MTSNMWVTTSQIMREEACCCQVLSYSFQLGNVFSFNDALNTFNLRLYGVRHMVKDHSDSERGNPLPPHRLLFPISTRVLLYAPSHRQDSTYHGLCYISCGALAGTRNSSMGPPHEGSIQRPIAPWANNLTMELHLQLTARNIFICTITQTE